MNASSPSPAQNQPANATLYGGVTNRRVTVRRITPLLQQQTEGQQQPAPPR